ncbi:MAG: 2-oxo acid dehydrogenase subunit E2 [Chloroflexi bacterium]|nr:2-oxo acid dehydrogenase subunit E2 [Chloroflexota bacterium]
MATNVVMPQLGESVVEGTIGKWFKQVGDKIEQYEPIMEVVTDKVTTEIPSPAAGTLLQILVPEGATVNAGTVLAMIGAVGEQPASPPTPQPPPPSPGLEVQPRRGGQGGEAPHNGHGAKRLTPVVARMIGEHNISDAELATIKGSGEGGRVTKKDIEAFVARRGERPAIAAPTTDVPPWEQPGTGELFRPTEEIFGKPTSPLTPLPPSPSPGLELQPRRGGQGGEEVIPLSPMRKAIAEHMVRSKTVAPHVTSVHEADMSRVLAYQKAHEQEFAKQGVKLTYTAFFAQAVVAALKAFPIVNASFTDQGVMMRRNYNIGIAVALEDGLIVPVIKNADEKSLLGIARAVNDLATRAREKRLSPDEVQGGTFTITNYGIFGSLFGTPVINQPQSAIMGTGTIQKRVVVINDAIAIRPMIYLSITIDHRLLDGATGDQFMQKVKRFLEEHPAE